MAELVVPADPGAMKPRSASHRPLSREGWPDVVFAFHDGEEIGPRMLARIATGANIQQVEAEIREAIEFHIDGLREEGSLIPLPSSQVEYIEIAA